ncbi:MAG: transposase, partial [Gemmatimonadales bacterium]|nr:transposase [Gemmatimonadales bacterium]
ALLARHGYGLDEDVDDEDPDDAQQVIQAAAVAGRSAVRRGHRARRVQVLGGRPYQLPPKCANCDGYGLHAGVVIGAKDRKGLERLCRYIARPPLAKPRLEERPDGGVRVRFKRPWSDGTEAIELSRVELVERLAALVPPPRANTVLYHGVLAARSAVRERVRPRGRKRSQRQRAAGDRLANKPSAASRWVPWAWLLWRAFDVDSWACPHCDQRMRLRAVVMAPATLEVLESLKRSARGPPAQAGKPAVA